MLREDIRWGPFNSSDSCEKTFFAHSTFEAHYQTAYHNPELE